MSAALPAALDHSALRPAEADPAAADDGATIAPPGILHIPGDEHKNLTTVLSRAFALDSLRHVPLTAEMIATGGTPAAGDGREVAAALRDTLPLAPELATADPEQDEFYSLAADSLMLNNSAADVLAMMKQQVGADDTPLFRLHAAPRSGLLL